MSGGWETLDNDAKRRFEKRARDPQAWRKVALDLHTAAGLLWERIEQATDHTEKAARFLSLGKIALMLEGLSVEMFAKALLVSQNCGLVGDGKWKGPQQGHPLTDLLNRAGFTMESPEEEEFITRLAEFVKWAGRYPTPRGYGPPTLTGEGKLELAPGTYYSTTDRHLAEHIIARLQNAI